MKWGALMSMFLATAAAADFPATGGAVGFCLVNTPRPQDCIGATLDACLSTPDGGTTYGMMACNLAERDVWDAALNEVYGRLVRGDTEADAEERAYFPEFAHREKNLRAAQQAWIAFRDAECGYVYARWGSGSMRQIAGSACLLDMTAKRYLELVDYLDAADMR